MDSIQSTLKAGFAEWIIVGLIGPALGISATLIVEKVFGKKLSNCTKNILFWGAIIFLYAFIRP